MPSWKVRISSSPPRRARNSTTTRSVCSPTAIAGNARSRRTSRSTRRTGDEMTVAALFFYLFASICVASAVMVIASKNPVHSVLFLILAFFNAAGLFVLMGAEFLAMILVVVYVGAVAVLFLFVVMMLDINFDELRHGMLKYLSLGGAIGAILLLELIFFAATIWRVTPDVANTLGAPTPPVADVSNTAALAHLLLSRSLLP